MIGVISGRTHFAAVSGLACTGGLAGGGPQPVAESHFSQEYLEIASQPAVRQSGFGDQDTEIAYADQRCLCTNPFKGSL